MTFGFYLGAFLISLIMGAFLIYGVRSVSIIIREEWGGGGAIIHDTPK